jgi:hypothetical protein
MFVPRTEARIALAKRFGLPYQDSMQDWEWEVADAKRFREWLDAYIGADLTDDERLSLMEMLIQCAEDMGPGPELESACLSLEPLLLARPTLHRASVEYWALVGEDDHAAQFAVSAAMRKTLNATA